MKKVLFALLVTSGLAFAQAPQVEYMRVDTAVITRLQASTTYSAGDIVRDSLGSAFFAVTISNWAGQGAWINYISLCADTANVTGANFTLIPYVDTTGVGKYIGADNAQFQQNYAFGTKRLPPISFSLKMYGTTGGGATSAWDSQTNLNIPFIVPTGKKLFFLLICDGAYLGKQYGKFRVTVATSYKR